MYDRVTSATDVLEGYANGTVCELKAVKPKYFGIFTFASSPNPKDSTEVQLSVEASDRTDGEGNASIEKREWSSPFEDIESRRMEAFVITLEG